MRELADGRVIIADRREKLLAAVAFTGAYSRRIGTNGDGAGQYLAAGPLLPMDGDTTALIDGAAGQWMLMKGSDPAGMVSPASLLVRAAHFPIGITPTHVYGIKLPSTGLGATAHDSMALIRVSRQGLKVDTITLLAAPTASRSVDTAPNQRTITLHISIPPSTRGEQAAFFDDGWMGIARLNPYRVDWIDPVGKVRLGKPISIPVDTNPPFTALAEVLNDLAPALNRGPSGELVIRRVQTPAEPEQRYDVIDRDGMRVAQIIMPPGETLLGIGKAHLYTVRTGEGRQRVRRYEWPLK
jgi:hypothetical protein